MADRFPQRGLLAVYYPQALPVTSTGKGPPVGPFSEPWFSSWCSAIGRCSNPVALFCILSTWSSLTCGSVLGISQTEPDSIIANCVSFYLYPLRLCAIAVYLSERIIWHFPLTKIHRGNVNPLGALIERWCQRINMRCFLVFKFVSLTVCTKPGFCNPAACLRRCLKSGYGTKVAPRVHAGQTFPHSWSLRLDLQSL